MTVLPKSQRNPHDYSVRDECARCLEKLLQLAGEQLPDEFQDHIKDVIFTAPKGSSNVVYLPCPFKETEATSVLKAVEACAAAAIADLRFSSKKRRIDIDLERATCFLFSAYLSTVDGMDKANPNVKSKLKDTDLLQAQSILYRRLSANLYQTKHAGEYFHLHGSLEATTALNMIGLEGHRPDMTDYHGCIDLIEKHVKQFSAEELEKINAQKRQAGVTCLKWEEFKKTKHGRTMLNQPPWTVEVLEAASPPVPFPDTKSHGSKAQILSGFRVLELCRIIAGPAIGRTLAEYGADVIKVTSPYLSDVPFFQVDGNMGKHTLDLNLRNPRDRTTFETLLESADVIIDGYRPGSLARLGYSPLELLSLTRHRNRGIVYVAEDCFGHVGDWADRPGWQQISDCVTGVAWAQGRDGMGLDEPVVPPFPMSDYGTGTMGAIAALTGLFFRAKYGGSYIGKVSLVQFDIFLLQLGLYPPEVIERMKKEHDRDFFELRHHDSVDEVGKRALKSMRRVHPGLFEKRMCHETFSKGFDAMVKYVRPVVEIEGLRNGFSRSSRPNGFDGPTWDGWEVEEDLVNGSEI